MRGRLLDFNDFLLLLHECKTVFLLCSPFSPSIDSIQFTNRMLWLLDMVLLWQSGTEKADSPAQ